MYRISPDIAKAKKTLRKSDRKVGNIIYPKLWSQPVFFIMGILCPLWYISEGPGWLVFGWALSWLVVFTSIFYEITHYVCLVDDYICIRYWNRYFRIKCKNIDRMLVHRSKMGVMFNYGVVFFLTESNTYSTAKIKNISAIRAHWFRYGPLTKNEVNT